jgi:hypothetical protein
MSKDNSYVARTRAIRACIAEHPGASSQRVVELLAAGGLLVSPAHVIVVQTLDRTEHVEEVAAAS